MGDDSQEDVTQAQTRQSAVGGPNPSSLAVAFGITDGRIEIIADYLLRHYRLKPDRWTKFYNNVDHVVSMI